MKQIFNISLFALLAMVFVGCENGDAWGDNDGNSVDVEIPVGGDYITFATDVQTRADLVTTNYIEDSFGVISYMYDPTISWGSYKVNAEPAVGALGGNSCLTKVSYNDGSYDYGEPVAWESMRYAFFAYAPYYDSPYDDNNAVVPSGQNVKGIPYVTYTLDTSDATKHADVITGYAANCSSAVSKNVTFKMSHRLAAVDVAAVNYYDYSHPSGATDSEGQPIYTTEKVTIEIQSMTAKFTNLQYGKAQISIDKSVPTVRTALGGKTATYPIIGGVYDLNPSASSEFDYITEKQKEKTTMLLIPQEYNPGELLTVEIVVDYKKRRPDGTSYLWTVVETVDEVGENGETITREYKVDIPAGTDTSSIDPNPDADGDIEVLGEETGGVFTTIQTASFDQELKEENRYYALLTFTSHAVSINILTAAAWDEKPVDYEFD